MKKMLLAALAVVGLATACRNEADELVVPASGPASLANLTRRYAPPVQVFEFDPTQPHTIRTAGGARLEIVANAFVRSDGSVPIGPAKLLFQEIYNPSEMILANMPTMGWDRNTIVKLESGGEFIVRAKEQTSGLALRLNRTNRSSDSKLIMRSPATGRVLANSSVSRMTQWIPSRWSQSLDSLVWMERDTFTRVGNPVLTVRIPFITDSIAGQGGAFLTTSWPDSLGLINIDVLYQAPGARVKVFLSHDSDLGETRAFFVPAALNGVFRPDLNIGINMLELDRVPQNTDLSAVVIQVKDGKYYFGTHRAPATSGFIYRPVMEEVSEEELVRRIRLL